MSDTFDALNSLKQLNRQLSREKRANNREWSTERLIELGVPFESRNAGAHLIVSCERGIIDFWPGTGKWIVRGGNRTDRGVRKLVAFIEGAP